MNENLERVSSRIATTVEKFFADVSTAPNPVFFAEELRERIASEIGVVAPDSPGRIMRALRQAGRINYRVLDRAQSYYQVLPA